MKKYTISEILKRLDEVNRSRFTLDELADIMESPPKMTPERLIVLIVKADNLIFEVNEEEAIIDKAEYLNEIRGYIGNEISFNRLISDDNLKFEEIGKDFKITSERGYDC